MDSSEGAFFNVNFEGRLLIYLAFTIFTSYHSLSDILIFVTRTYGNISPGVLLYKWIYFIMHRKYLFHKQRFWHIFEVYNGLAWYPTEVTKTYDHINFL